MAGPGMRPLPNAMTRRTTKRFGWRALIFLLTAACLLSSLLGQAGRQAHPSSSASTLLNVVATRANGATKPITAKDISLFDNGVEQNIRNFAPDLSPARIVLLVDNSLTIRADVDKLEKATLEFAYEIFDGDKLLIVGYDNNAEIVSDWTDNAKKIEAESGDRRPCGRNGRPNFSNQRIQRSGQGDLRRTAKEPLRTVISATERAL